VDIKLRSIGKVASKDGRAIDAGKLAASVGAALSDPNTNRILEPRLKVIKPKVTTGGLSKAYGTIVTIDRGNFKLRLFKRLRLVKTYPIAVGQAGLETPAGIRHVLDKQVNPTWYVPNSPWAGSLAGQVIPPSDPRDPLKARLLDLGGGFAIHGTAEDWSIGTRASHGCIRMHVSDVIDLYPRVPVGTPVLIH
jgi:lipoprotein-anchoring transpeptidase ErfK/SrfK